MNIRKVIEENSIRIISSSFMVLYLILCMVFYRERMLDIDGPSFVLGMINEQGFFFPLGRYASALFQVIPLILFKAGSSLNTILIGWSLSIALIYVAIFAVLQFGYRNTFLALTWVIFLWVFTYDSFFMCVSELPLGIGILLLLLGYLGSEKDHDTIVNVMISLSLIVLIAGSHPLMLFPAAFCFLLTFLPGSMRPDWASKTFHTRTWLLLIVLFIILRILLIGHGEIPKVGRMENMFANYKTLFLDQNTNYYLKQYIRYTYLPGAIIFTIACIALALSKKFRLLSVLLFCSGTFALVFIASHPDYNFRIFTEIYFLVVAFFLAYSLAHLITEGKNIPVLLTVIMILLIQAGRIIDYSADFRERNRIYLSVLEQMEKSGIEKAVIPFYNAPMRKVMYTFGNGKESLLISKLNEQDPLRTFAFICTDSIASEDVSKSKTVFINSEWDTLWTDKFNSGFFPLDTTSSYRIFNPDYSAF